jgi:hypothetical protein
MTHPDQPQSAPDAGDSAAPALDPAIQEARSARDASPDSATASIDPLQKERDALLLADPSTPHHALFEQALKGLEQLGSKRFKDRRELERIALAIAVQASAVGLTRVDRVALSDNGAGYFFADTQAVDPALRGYVALADVLKPDAAQRPLDVQRVQAQQVQEQRTHDAQQQQLQQSQREVELRARQGRDAPGRGSQERTSQERASQERASQDRAPQDRGSQQGRASQERVAQQERAVQDRAPRRL